MASSVICSKKSTFQYHCSPLGTKASKAVCSTEYGIGASPTNREALDLGDAYSTGPP
jgi:hypothetical protein